MNDRIASLELENQPYYRNESVSPRNEDMQSNALMMTNMDQFMDIINNE